MTVELFPTLRVHICLESVSMTLQILGERSQGSGHIMKCLSIVVAPDIF